MITTRRSNPETNQVRTQIAFVRILCRSSFREAAPLSIPDLRGVNVQIRPLRVVCRTIILIGARILRAPRAFRGRCIHLHFQARIETRQRKGGNRWEGDGGGPEAKREGPHHPTVPPGGVHPPAHPDPDGGEASEPEDTDEGGTITIAQYNSAKEGTRWAQGVCDWAKRGPPVSFHTLFIHQFPRVEPFWIHFPRDV